MKKVICLGIVGLVITFAAQAQVLPSFQFGVKGGVNLSNFTTDGTFNSNNQAGYLAGFWARVGALGFNFQPELYYSSKNVDVNSNGIQNKASFNSIDMPLLLGTKVGVFGIGGRFYTGPVVSFAVNNNQSLSNAASNAARLKFKNQNLAWQFGAGLDIKSISIDLRYEAGISKQSFEQNPDAKTRINLFNLTLGYRLFSL